MLPFIDAVFRVIAKHLLEKYLHKISKYLTLFKTEYQLEAHPIETNQQLLNFDVRSKGISWVNLVTPLQPRGSARYLNESYNDLRNQGFLVAEGNRREVLVCHDMMGNYLEDKYFSSSKKWDDYRFYHWSGIDYFCYFSHKYVTIPPANWINAAHAHGVRVLGTFITEGAEGTRRLKEVLQSKVMIDYIVDSLIRLCEHFCFEGWLINIECPVDATNIESLTYFVDSLRMRINNQIPNGVVFWYDSVINTGHLSWQNEINDRNVQFFNVSNGTLINYAWNDSSLQRTDDTVYRTGRKHENVFFGIDVFARGQVAKFHSSRTLARIVRYNFSVGIFAPAWTYEGLAERGYNIRNRDGDNDVNESFLLRNDKFWGLLWRHLATHSYFKTPFYTDFCLGSGKFTFDYGRRLDEQFFALSRQSLQPSVPLKDNAENCFDYAVNGGSCLKIVAFNRPFRLFMTEFRIDKTLVFAYVSKVNDPSSDIDCILVLHNEYGTNGCELICGNYENSFDIGRIYAKPVNHETFSAISQILNSRNLPLKIPYHMPGFDDWHVRYYVARFDEIVILRDIGVHFRTPLTQPEGYLGAIYVHCVNDYVPSAFQIYTGLSFSSRQ